MTRHRTIILIAGSLMAFAGVGSDAAMGSSLLSGYGGPGQGNQALLGSAMLNGPGGGGGSAGAALSPTSSTPVNAEALSAGARRTSTGARPGRAHRGPARVGSQANPATGQPSAPTRISDVYAAAERGASAPSTGLLGLSGTDFLLIVVVLCTLGFIGVLTRRLTRASPLGRQR